jgi:uncharacterized protein (DUF1499 family)
MMPNFPSLRRPRAPIILLLAVMFMNSPRRSDGETLMPPCPSSPNCVSSLATDNHYIEPLMIRGDAGACFDRLKEVLVRRRDTRIVEADGLQIRAEFRTLLGFVDNGLFVLDAPQGLIHVRSAARSGYWDMGKNRRRVEEIRSEYSR